MRISCIFIVILLITGFQLNAQDERLAWYCPPCGMDCDTIVHEQSGRCAHCGMELLHQTAEQHENTMNIRNMTIGFYLQPGVEVLDFAGPMEVFSYAGFNVVTISDTKEPITSQGILEILPDYSIDDAPDLDVVAFFGGGSAARSAKNNTGVINWLRNLDGIDYYFSVCTGAFYLAEAGLLKGLSATTFHSAIDDLRADYPETTVLDNARYVDNGHVITTAGISAGIDGALHFVAKFAGQDAANRIAENMEYDKWVPREGVVVKQ